MTKWIVGGVVVLVGAHAVLGYFAWKKALSVYNEASNPNLAIG